MTAAPVRCGATIDELLGPADGRFFGHGFRGAVRALADLRCGAATVAATATVGYPGGWSRKAGVAQQPHLSTVDAIVLACRVAEAHLELGRGLDPAGVAGSWVRRLRIRAGTRPLEGEALAAFPVSGAVEGEPEPAGADRAVTRLACRLGPMGVLAELDHPRAAPGPVPARSGPLPLPGWTAHRHRIDDVLTEASGAAVQARVQLTGPSGAAPLLESAYRPSATLVDAFVVGLQLGQAMLYRLDDLDRADSATLWMRSAELQVATPRRPVPHDGPVRGRLRNPQLLTPTGKGRWRRADIEAELCGVRVRCSVAHALPDPAGSRR